MKKSFIFMFTVFMILGLYAEDVHTKNFDDKKSIEKASKNTIALGLKTGSFVENASVGIGLTSPWFLEKHLAVRMNIDMVLRTSTWRPYLSSSMTFLGGEFMRTANIRLYGGGGPLLLFPCIDGEPVVYFGGQGFAGFEFFLGDDHEGMSYYIEIGGLGGMFSKKHFAGYPTGPKIHSGFRYNFGL